MYAVLEPLRLSFLALITNWSAVYSDYLLSSFAVASSTGYRALGIALLAPAQIHPLHPFDAVLSQRSRSSTSRKRCFGDGNGKSRIIRVPSEAANVGRATLWGKDKVSGKVVVGVKMRGSVGPCRAIVQSRSDHASVEATVQDLLEGGVVVAGDDEVSVAVRPMNPGIKPRDSVLCLATRGKWQMQKRGQPNAYYCLQHASEPDRSVSPPAVPLSPRR